MLDEIQEGNGGSWYSYGKDLTEAMAGVVKSMIFCKDPDVAANIESHFYNTLIVADSVDYELNIGKELWLNRSRWSRLMKEYIDRDHLDRFIAQAHEIIDGDARKGATANFLFRDPERYEKKHRWGGCLMGATFRGDPDHDPTITFYSRTTYIGYMGMMDAAIATCMAQEIWPENWTEIKFRWMITSAQLHCFKTLPYIFSRADLFNRLQKDSKEVRIDSKKIPRGSLTWRNMLKWFIKIEDAWKEHGDDMLEYEKYGPFKRIKRRWMEHMGYSQKNLPPDLLVGQLNFDKCKRGKL